MRHLRPLPFVVRLDRLVGEIFLDAFNFIFFWRIGCGEINGERPPFFELPNYLVPRFYYEGYLRKVGTTLAQIRVAEFQPNPRFRGLVEGSVLFCGELGRREMLPEAAKCARKNHQ